jgi:hypothetical protein
MPFNNILEYVEGPTGLNWSLYPVQRFILKLYYGLELDDTNRTIIVPDMFQEQVRFSFTEQEYLRFLFEEGRCSVHDTSTLPRMGMVLSVGRRVGKDMLAGFIATYTIAELLQIMNPHPVFGMNRQRLNVLCFSMNFELRNELTSNLQYCVMHCQDLQSAVTNSTLSGIDFETHPRRQARGTQGNLRLRSYSSVARTRGYSSVMLVINELAHMTHESEVYAALMPTVTGRYAILSTPRESSGAFYNAFVHGMQNHDQNAPLALQIPTWEIHQGLGSGYLRTQYELDPRRFLIEFGAVWAHHGRLVTIEVVI